MSRTTLDQPHALAMGVEKGSPVFYTMPVVAATVTRLQRWCQHLYAPHWLVDMGTKKRTIGVLMGSARAMVHDWHPLMMTFDQLGLQNASFLPADVRFGI